MSICESAASDAAGFSEPEAGAGAARMQRSDTFVELGDIYTGEYSAAVAHPRGRRNGRKSR